jgi:hypothetical protein
MISGSRADSHHATLSTEAWMVSLAGLLGCIGWAIHIGPDANWDFLNYHLYLGLHANGDRLGKDYFPAGGAGYLAPYAYWPLAQMIAAKWPGVLVGSIMGGIHSLAVIATWYLSLQLFPQRSRKETVLRLSATAIGVICPIVLIEVGSSFIDLSTAVPVVLGVAWLLRALRIDQSRLLFVALAGLSLGLASALKLTNALYAGTAVIALAITWIYRSDVNWRMLIAICAAEGAGFANGYG